VIIRVFNQFPEYPGNERRPGLLAIVCAMPSLPEDLVILAAGARPRSGPGNGKLPWRFVYGMLGAVLVALTLAGRVEIADGQIVVRNPSPLGDPNLDEALAALAAVRTVPVAQWMADSRGGFVTAWFDRLEAAGVLTSETVWLLFIARRKGFRLADQDYFENLRGALRGAVTGTRPIEPAMAALAGLLHAGSIADLLYPGRENAAVRARLAELAGQDPAMTVPGTGTADDPFMHATQAAVHSAVHHSVHAAVSAAATTSHHPGGSSSGGDSSPSHHHH
jgi:Golgi phosphoprotein 3 (GPP34)